MAADSVEAVEASMEGVEASMEGVEVVKASVWKRWKVSWTKSHGSSRGGITMEVSMEVVDAEASPYTCT